MNESKLTELNLKGWTNLDNIYSDSDILKLARSIGNITPHPNGNLIFTLTPKSGSDNIKGTFSNKFGFGNFPLHTDTAFWAKPVRYILMSSLNVSSCKTIITSATSILEQLNSKELQLAERAIFKIQTIHNQFYTSLLFRENGVQGIKYDSTCMKPINLFAKQFVQFMNEITPASTPINWSGNKAIIIDNWKMLHGRSIVNIDEKREIKRIYIN